MAPRVTRRQARLAQTVAGDHTDGSSHNDGSQSTWESSESTTQERLTDIDDVSRRKRREKFSSRVDKGHQDLSKTTVWQKPPTMLDISTPGHGSRYNQQGRLETQRINQESLETPSSLPNPAIHTAEKSTRTTPSANTTLISEPIKKSITHICEDIYHELQPQVDLKRSRAMMRNLGELVEAFAIRIHFDESHDMDPMITHFVYKHHNEICAQLRAKFMDGDVDDSDPGQSKSENLSLAGKMEMWKHEPSEDLEDDELVSASDLPLYNNKGVFKSAAYTWLLSTLKHQAALSYGDGHATIASDETQQVVLRQLQAGTLRVPSHPGEHRASFRLPRCWSNLKAGSSFGDSRYQDTRLQNILVLIASSTTDAQVTTAGQYMHQVWPDSGALLLQGFQDLIEGKASDGPISFHIHDTTYIRIEILGSDINVVCIGPAYFVTQCAVQLSWIQCALQAPQDCVAIQTPYLEQIGTSHFLMFSRDETMKRPEVVSHLELAGQWWHFEAPCVWGFPTPWRPEGFQGVDLPLGLADISQILLPHLSLGCPQQELILSWLWHLASSCACSTKFVASSNPDLKGLNFDDIARDQHILGRCDDLIQLLKTRQYENSQKKEMDQAEESLARVAYTTKIKSLDHCSPAMQSAQSDSVDTDLLSIASFSCDEEDEAPQSNQFIIAIVDSIALKLVSKTTYRQTPTLGVATCDEESTSNTQCAAGNSAQGLQVKPASSGLNKGKRKAGDRDEEDDGEDLSRNGGSGKRIKTAEASVPQQTFACPFWKLDPNKHRACFHARLLNSSRVKQHLTRRHTLTFYCQVCFAVFKEESAQEQHVFQRSCIRVPGMLLDGITPYQQSQLSKKPKQTMTEEEKWYRIWDIVLPNRPRPESPYIDSQLSDCCARFREHWQNLGPDMLLAEIQSSGAISTSTMDDTATTRTLRMILARGLDMIWESWTPSSTTQQPGRIQFPDTPAYTQEHGSARPGNSTPSSGSAVNINPKTHGDLRATPWLSTQHRENSAIPTSSTAVTYAGAANMLSQVSASGAIQFSEQGAESHNIFDMFDDSVNFTSGQNPEGDGGDNGTWTDIEFDPEVDYQ